MSTASAVPASAEQSASIAAHMAELIQGVNRFRACVHAAAPGESDSSMYTLLFHVLANGPMRSGELAETTQADPSTVSRQVATLVGRGLLERRADPQDGRASLLHGTAAGVEYRDRQIARRNVHFGELLAGWSEVDRVHFADFLARFNEDFARYKDTWFAALTADQTQPRKASA